MAALWGRGKFVVPVLLGSSAVLPPLAWARTAEQRESLAVELSSSGQAQLQGSSQRGQGIVRSEKGQVPFESLVDAGIDTMGAIVSNGGSVANVHIARENPAVVATPPLESASLTEESAEEAVKKALDMMYGRGGDDGRAALLETDNQIIPGMSAADAAYKVMDVLNGVTGIIPEDYPYACLCDEAGKCIDDILKTTCMGRPGNNHAIHQAGGVGLTALLVLARVMAMAV